MAFAAEHGAELVGGLLSYTDVQKSANDILLEHYDWCAEHRLRIVSDMPRSSRAVQLQLPSIQDFKNKILAITRSLGSCSLFVYAIRKRLRAAVKLQSWFIKCLFQKNLQVARWLRAWEEHEMKLRAEKRGQIAKAVRKLNTVTTRENHKKSKAECDALYQEFMMIEVLTELKLTVIKSVRREQVQEKILQSRTTPNVSLSPVMNCTDLIALLPKYHGNTVAQLSDLALTHLTLRALANIVVSLRRLARIIKLPREDRPVWKLLPHERVVALLFSTLPPRSRSQFLPISNVLQLQRLETVADSLPAGIYGEEELCRENEANAAAQFVSTVHDFLSTSDMSTNATTTAMIQHLVVGQSSHLQNVSTSLRREIGLSQEKDKRCKKVRNLAMSHRIVSVLERGGDLRRHGRHHLASAIVVLSGCVMSWAHVQSVCNSGTVFVIANMKAWSHRRQFQFHYIGALAAVVLACAIASRAANIRAQPFTRSMKKRLEVMAAVRGTSHLDRENFLQSPRAPLLPPAKWRLPSPVAAPTPPTPPSLPPTPPESCASASFLDECAVEFDTFFDELSRAPLPEEPTGGVIFPVKPVPYKREVRRHGKSGAVTFAEASTKDESFWYWWHKGGEGWTARRMRQRRDTMGRRPALLKPPPAGHVLASFVPYVPPPPSLRRARPRHCRLQSSRLAGEKTAAQKWSRRDRLTWIEDKYTRLVSPPLEAQECTAPLSARTLF